MVLTEKQTLHDLVEDLAEEPTGGGSIVWPPDVFALCANALRLTGAYRLATNIGEDPAWPPEQEWIRRVEEDADRWWSWILKRDINGRNHHDGLESVKTLNDSLEVFRKHATTIQDDLTFIGKHETRDNECREKVSQALLRLLGLADHACAGFGLPFVRRTELALPHYLANTLLTETGTMSTRPRSRGIVLPKLRTAQLGVTLRSFSHNLTYHQSEAEIAWRAMPWPNLDENTLNILVIPWPFEVSAEDFHPYLSLGKARSVGNARFFGYRPAEDDELPGGLVKKLLVTARARVGRIHLIALPELAVTPDTFNSLKKELQELELPGCDIPMILTGIGTNPRDGSEGGRQISATNQVVLSVFFGERWYDFAQDKHHRWKIDESQIRQYGLGGVLSGGREWWERIDIPNRRLSFVVPNGWFALTPLICEDLARQDPISELVRGVGPTLVLAILFDGPQRKDRWSGRYASVLADDPGSSVLTVTSLGMSERSRIPKGSTQATQKTLGLRNTALWRDSEYGWHEVDLDKEKDEVASVLSVTASWIDEFTADGRKDDVNAARFLLENDTPFERELVAEYLIRKKVDSPSSEGAASESESDSPTETANHQHENPRETEVTHRSPENSPDSKVEPTGRADHKLIEISVLAYLAAALLEGQKVDREEMMRVALYATNTSSDPSPRQSTDQSEVDEIGANAGGTLIPFNDIIHSLQERSPIRLSSNISNMSLPETTDREEINQYRFAAAVMKVRFDVGDGQTDSACGCEVLEQQIEESRLDEKYAADGNPDAINRIRIGKLIRACCRRQKDLTANNGNSTKELTVQLADLATELGPAEDDALRLSHCVDMGILWAVHTSISERNRKGEMTTPWARLLAHTERALKMRPHPNHRHGFGQV